MDDRKKNVLVIGSGGREHALCWKLAQSSRVEKVFCSPGNGGIREVAECVHLGGEEAIVDFCRVMNIALVVIGPEQPLVDGLADALAKANIAVFGPSQQAAQLEASKAFTKNLCRKYDIPTAAYESFTEAAPAKAYLATQSFPVVVKADGLAAGKGVIIAESLAEAEAAVEEMFGGAFGAAGAKVVIEEFLEGEELSFFALSDGETAVEFGHAQDHKRVGEGDTGPNTGGMGTYAPARIASDSLRAEAMERIVRPTVEAMQKEGTPFRGVLFAGLMITKKGPMLLEYNARFGDPETQVLMRRLEGDLFEILSACARGDVRFAEGEIRMRKEAALCVVMAAKGYPGAYAKGSVIGGLDKAAALPGVEIFHAGTEARVEGIVSSGGRVLGVTALGKDIAEAQKNAYRAVDSIDWPEGFCRRDIGWRAVKE